MVFVGSFMGYFGGMVACYFGLLGFPGKDYRWAIYDYGTSGPF